MYMSYASDSHSLGMYIYLYLYVCLYMYRYRYIYVSVYCYVITLCQYIGMVHYSILRKPGMHALVKGWITYSVSPVKAGLVAGARHFRGFFMKFMIMLSFL